MVVVVGFYHVWGSDVLVMVKRMKTMIVLVVDKAFLQNDQTLLLTAY